MFWTIAGVIVAVVAVVVTIVLWRTSQRIAEDEEMRHELQRREEERRIADAERESRIEAVVTRYARNVVQNSGMSGALEAGVLSLQSGAEVADFIKRSRARAPRDAVLPPFAEAVPPRLLLEFFRRLAHIPDWFSQEGKVKQLVDELVKIAANDVSFDQRPLDRAR